LISVQKALDEIRAGIFSEDLDLQLRSTRDAERMLENANAPLIEAFIKAGIVPRLVKFLRRKSWELVAMSTLVLSQIANQHTQAVVDAGAVPHLIRLLSSDNSQLIRGSNLVLISIVAKKPDFRDFVVECGIVEPLLRLARSEISPEIIITIYWLVDQGSSDFIKKMTPTLLELLQHADDEIVSHACKAVFLAIRKTDAI
jgi:hypothetical protein